MILQNLKLGVFSAPQLRGGMLLTLGICIFGFADNLTILLADQVGVGQFLLSRSLIALAILILFARIFGLRLLPYNWYWVLVRTFFIAVAMLFYFSSLSLMPAAEAGAGLFISPICVLIFSWVLFGERIGIRRITAVALGSIGVLLVLKPGSDSSTIFHLFPLFAGAFYAMCSIITYRYCGDESPFALTLIFLSVVGLMGFASASLLTVFPASPHLLEQAFFIFSGWQWVDIYFWLWMFFIALCGVVGMTLISNGYQLTETSYIVVYEYSYLIAAGFSGWLLFGDVLDRYSLIGICFIILAGVIITYAKRRALRLAAEAGLHE